MIKFLISIIMAIDSLGFHIINAEETLLSKNEPNLQVAVMSDIHIDLFTPEVNEKFKTALQDIIKIAPGYDVIAVGGDMTNYGLLSEYDIFNQILQNNKNPYANEFMVMGNHEWLEYQMAPNTTVTDSQLIDRFTQKMNVPNLYYDKWINGYHFITIAGEKSEATLRETYGESVKDSAYISDTQYEWLEETLPIHAENNKPIFVFFHQPIKNTVYGSDWGAGFDEMKLLSLLKKYPQVILFTGHSHYPLNHPMSITSDGITMVNTSSVAYTYTPEVGQSYKNSQGYIVNVYDDKVILKAREFSTGEWIKVFTIPILQK